MKPPLPDRSPPSAPTADPFTLAGFVLFVFLVAFNVIAIRYTNQELPPFWAAGTRFAVASSIFLIIVLIRRLPLPRGRALLATLLYGSLQFGVAFSLGYFALQELPAGLASIIFASVPLFTLLFAIIARLETLRLRSILGALIAVGGIAFMLGQPQKLEIPFIYYLSAIGAAAFFSLAPVIVKLIPQVHPASMNALGMLTGTVFLLTLSWVIGEEWVIPVLPATWAAQLFLIVPGSVGLFALMLFLLGRWTASGVSYQTVLSPILTIILSIWLLDEPLTGGLFLGGIFILAGVYVGAISSGRKQKTK